MWGEMKEVVYMSRIIALKEYECTKAYYYGVGIDGDGNEGREIGNKFKGQDLMLQYTYCTKSLQKWKSQMF